MRGAVAAGHPVTAEVGAEVLRRGGNAVDACVAAGFASWVTESPLTGPGGGGFMLVHTPRATRLLDFFVTVPSGERPAPEEITVTFSGGQHQDFRVGKGTCAVPGTAAGLEEVHRRYGRLSWRDVVAPAIEVARSGVDVNEGQAFLHEILDLVLHETPVVGLGVGERFVWEDLANTLQRIAEHGAADFYAGELARRISACVPSIRPSDLSGYRPVWRRPIRTSYRGSEFVSNPPPSSGGVLICLGLKHLEDPGRAGTADSVLRLAQVMELQTKARNRRLSRKLLEVGGTTHVSVLDAAGNAASLSVSTGAGSGVVVPGTGIHLNNMLGGELDLAISNPRPGHRLTSMMAPSLAVSDGRPRLVLGSAGSNRLRGAIMQVVVNVLGHGMGIAAAIDQPRVHLEKGVLHLEPELEAPPGPWEAVARWPEQNLFFGGVSAVEQLPDGELGAAGDARRGGAGIVVDP
jgi:gamma-glutamyltranspeptidase / glutathione hydrolase